METTEGCANAIPDEDADVIAVDERDFMLLKRRIYIDTKLDYRQYKDAYLKRRFAVRLRATGLRTFGEYLNYIIKTPGEYEELLNTIAINVTQFFRDGQVFRVIADEVIPEIIYQKVSHNRKVIRIWSAGCASGEEIYSLAIILKEVLGERYNSFHISLHATDIDLDALAHAKNGLYAPTQMDNVGEDLRKRYFAQEGDMYRVKSELRANIKFRQYDLFSEVKPPNFDLILNRNVMIYFTREMQKRLLYDFYESLNDGGFLVIGKTEMLTGPATLLFTHFNSKERIYKKERK